MATDFALEQIVDLSITEIDSTIDDKVYVPLILGSTKGTVALRKGSDEEEVRYAITQKFHQLLKKQNLVVVGIYRYRHGGICSLEMLGTRPQTFVKNTYFVYALPKTPELRTMTCFGLDANTFPRAPAIDIKTIYEDSPHDNAVLFTNIIRRFGYARFVLPEEHNELYDKALAVIAEFFNQPSEFKKKYSSETFPGYCISGLKEYVHVNHTMFQADHPNQKFVPDVADFGNVIGEFYALFRKFAVTSLLAIGRATGFPREYLADMIAEEERVGRYSTSHRLFRYNRVPDDLQPQLSAEKTETYQRQCVEHVDTDLITVSPCTVPAEVELVDRLSARWVCPEEGAGPREILIFPGMYLGWLTAGHLIAPIHRVVHRNPNPRISTPYFLRCPKSYVLDRSHLKPEIAPSAPRSKMTVKEFLKTFDNTF